MKLLKSDPDFEKKMVEWYGEEPDKDFVDSIDKVAIVYKKWGRADARRGNEPADDKYFQAGGNLAFPTDPDMAEATASYMKLCYTDGYQEGGVA